ncbi:hypothetical protein EON62_00830 [archaeon]|nr:MAG: hypothetical protein EON62_00830 [archaeon]
MVPKPASADAASPEVSNSVPPPPSAGAPAPHATAPSMPAVEPQEVKMAWHDGRVIQLLPSWRALQQVDAVVWGGGEPAAPAAGGGEPGALHGPANAAGAAVGSAQPPSHVALGISQAGSTNDTDGGAGVLAPAQAAAGSSASSGAPLTRARSHSVTSHGSDVSAGSSSSGAKRRRKKEKKEKKKRKKVARERAYVDAVAAASMQASAAAGAYGAGINTLYMPALAPGGYAVPGAAYVPPAAFAAYAPPAAGVAGASAGAGGTYPAPPRYDASGAAYMQPPVNIAR